MSAPKEKLAKVLGTDAETVEAIAWLLGKRPQSPPKPSPTHFQAKE